MATKLRPQALQRGAALQIWSATIPPGVTLDDLLDAATWSLHADRLNPGDLVRCRAADGTYDVMLVVEEKRPGGVVVDLWPRMPAGLLINPREIAGYDTAAGTAASED